MYIYIHIYIHIYIYIYTYIYIYLQLFEMTCDLPCRAAVLCFSSPPISGHRIHGNEHVRCSLVYSLFFCSCDSIAFIQLDRLSILSNYLTQSFLFIEETPSFFFQNDANPGRHKIFCSETVSFTVCAT